ncbi:hypothetical protein RA280_24745 [Cupriavidus sp. CV2]|uniref:phage neck terminator protein n=1 Tax=Cupriavidus ulmosensis TaxID=3065913 RepID=UPI00296AEB79|nr:hypothetical protein [Cupriavidus sp. CV2]MDW3684903.1 hypothetical protein [Cupriavidus sp. CV2]
MNDSSTGGYLAPAVASPPLEGDALDDVLQALVVGITGLPGAMVRPRWQPTVPKQPEPGVNWCAFGITSTALDAGPAFVHAGDYIDGVVLADSTPVVTGTGPVAYSNTNGRDTYWRHEQIEMLCTFYGPSGMQYAAQLRDGLYVPQNREQLGLLDMAFVEAGTIRAAPDLVNQQWVRRYDLTVTLRRKITRTYPVLNLKSAQVATTTDASAPVASTINIHE